jgi:hypothetical protein
MSRLRTDHVLVTDEELHALLDTEPSVEPSLVQPEPHFIHDAVTSSRVDPWFKFRNFFLLILISAFCIKLLFFTHVAVANFANHERNAAELTFYFKLRALFVIAISAVYLYSYLKDWYFEKVALLYVGIAATALVMDYFNAYANLSETPLQWVSGLIALRVLAIVCLVLNAVHARQAPPMPRYLWS